MASFQTKIGSKTPRKRKIRIIGPFRSYTTRNRKFQKDSKKLQKTKKCHYGFLSSQNRLGKAEKEKQLKLLVRSFPT